MSPKFTAKHIPTQLQPPQLNKNIIVIQPKILSHSEPQTQQMCHTVTDLQQNASKQKMIYHHGDTPERGGSLGLDDAENKSTDPITEVKYANSAYDENNSRVISIINPNKHDTAVKTQQMQSQNDIFIMQKQTIIENINEDIGQTVSIEDSSDVGVITEKN